MTLTPTLAALSGSIATAIAIFGGRLAVEADKWSGFMSELGSQGDST